MNFGNDFGYHWFSIDGNGSIDNIPTVNRIYEGRVEVKYRQQWGLVCVDGWDLKDVQVVCRMLGYDRAFSVPNHGQWGNYGFQGKWYLTEDWAIGKMILDDVDCDGDETTLAKCRHAGFVDHNCKPNEVAGAACAKEGTEILFVSSMLNSDYLTLSCQKIYHFIFCLKVQVMPRSRS